MVDTINYSDLNLQCPFESDESNFVIIRQEFQRCLDERTCPYFVHIIPPQEMDDQDHRNIIIIGCVVGVFSLP